jgi:glycosyltransferase involved in cell wall biosynthesis
MSDADKALTPTEWQASSYPTFFRDRISVIHEGVNTEFIRPDEAAFVHLPGMAGPIRRGDEILSYSVRHLEPHRGYHTFMRALPRILAERRNAHVVIAGGDQVGYGPMPRPGLTWKTKILDEVRERLDLSRVHFVGVLPYEQFVQLMQVTRVHAYLTYPFVLSWSVL